MTPVQGGKHCAHCQKTVVDFTRMSDVTLLHYVQLNGLGCGRILETQLDRLIEAPEQPRRKWWPQVMLGLGLFLGIPKDAFAQWQKESAPSTMPVQQPTEKVPVYTFVDNAILPDTSNGIFISGILLDQGGAIINGVINVTDQNNKIIAQALTDYDGLYRIGPLNMDYAGQTVEIEAKYLGFKKSEFLVFQYLNNTIRTMMDTRSLNRPTVIRTGGLQVRHLNYFQRKYYRFRRSLHSK